MYSQCIYLQHDNKIAKVGNSYAVRIPKYLVQGIKLEQGSEIEIKYYNQSLVIKPKKNKKSTRSKSLLKELRLKTGIKLYLTGRILAKKKQYGKKLGPRRCHVAFFKPGKGHEQSGRRPVIVLTKRNTTGRPDVFLCARLQQKKRVYDGGFMRY